MDLPKFRVRVNPLSRKIEGVSTGVNDKLKLVEQRMSSNKGVQNAIVKAQKSRGSKITPYKKGTLSKYHVKGKTKTGQRITDWYEQNVERQAGRPARFNDAVLKIVDAAKKPIKGAAKLAESSGYIAPGTSRAVDMVIDNVDVIKNQIGTANERAGATRFGDWLTSTTRAQRFDQMKQIPGNLLSNAQTIMGDTQKRKQIMEAGEYIANEVEQYKKHTKRGKYQRLGPQTDAGGDVIMYGNNGVATVMEDALYPPMPTLEDYQRYYGGGRYIMPEIEEID